MKKSTTFTILGILTAVVIATALSSSVRVFAQSANMSNSTGMMSNSTGMMSNSTGMMSNSSMMSNSIQHRNDV